MESDDIEELKECLDRAMRSNKDLLDEIEIKNRTIKLLLVAGHLDKEKLTQATELAGGDIENEN